MSITLFESKHTIINTYSDFLLNRNDLDLAVLSKAKMVVFTQQLNNQEEEDFLKKILTACKMTSSDYCMIEIKQDRQIAWNQIRDDIQPIFVLSFGIPANKLGILALFKFNSSNAFDNCQFIFVDSLSTLQNNVALKKTLWTDILKPIFDK
jgi:hypothetical protein